MGKIPVQVERKAAFPEKTRCVILAAGKISDYDALRPLVAGGAFVICADGGYRHAAAFGIVPQLFIGDGDSCPPGEITADEVIRLPREKDDTDTLFCAREGVRRGYCDFLILGATRGPRLDHLFANFCVLDFLLTQGAFGRMADEYSEIQMIENTRRRFSRQEGVMLSVFPFGGAASGVTLRGVKYPLTDATLTSDFPIGVSNAFVPSAEYAEIEVKSGKLLIFMTQAD